MGKRRRNNRTYEEIQKSVLARRSVWREANERVKNEERRAKENPRAFVAQFIPNVRRQRLHIQSFLLGRFGVAVDYYSNFGTDKVRFPGLFGEQYLAFPERFPLRFDRCPEDYEVFLAFRAWSDLLYWFDGAWTTIVRARAWAAREGADPDATVVEDVFEYVRMGPWTAAPTRQTEPDPVLRQQYAEDLAGWVGSYISLGVNARVRDALADVEPNGGPYTKLLEELLPTTVIAYDQLRTADSVAAPGSGKTNLVSRVLGLLEKLGGQEAKLAREGKLAYEKPDSQFVDGEDDVSDFVLRETMREHLSLVDELAQREGFLTAHQRRVWELDMLGYDAQAIADETGMAPSTVRQHRYRYVHKFKKAFEAAGLL